MCAVNHAGHHVKRLSRLSGFNQKWNAALTEAMLLLITVLRHLFQKLTA
jgi:hypothetical protein